MAMLGLAGGEWLSKRKANRHALDVVKEGSLDHNWIIRLKGASPAR
jgi:hypothetical protein